jgi:hypothetical protein
MAVFNCSQRYSNEERVPGTSCAHSPWRRGPTLHSLVNILTSFRCFICFKHPSPTGLLFLQSSFPLHFEFKGILTPGLVFIAPCFQHNAPIYHGVMIPDRSSWCALNYVQFYNEVFPADQLYLYGISIPIFGESISIIRRLCDW